MSYTLTLTEAHLEAARELGREAARAAASWVTDGNDSTENRQRLLLLLEHGDPEADAYLPARPDLSGEWADSPTPRSVAAVVLGDSAVYRALEAAHGHNADAYLDGDHVDALAQAWEDGASEAFEFACAAELRKWGALTGEELAERYG